MANYYEILGIPRDADSEQIKKAYRKLALECHPDRNDGSKEAEERFKEVTRAYEVLKDPDKRALYDRHGEQGVRGAPGGGAGPFDFSDALEIFMRDFGGFGGFGDVFGQAGRRGGRGAAQQKGAGLRVRLPLDLQDVAHGARKTLRVQILDNCDACGGKGSAEGADPAPCSTCGGTGEERHVQRTVFGQFMSVQPCRRCGGEGQVIEKPCPRCHGDGRVRVRKEIEVDVPAGVTSENFLTLRGRGNAGPRGGPRGDVIVLLEVEEDPRFRREGSNLVYDLVVTVGQAVLGDEVEVPTVEGVAKVSVPSGTQSGQMLRLRGHGLPELEGTGRGDQLVRVMVWTPERLTPEQEEIYRRLREIEDAPPDGASTGAPKGFWSRVKEAFR